MTATIRSEAASADLGVSHLERVIDLFSDPDLYEFTDDLVVRDPTKGGRPQMYPAYFVFAVDCLADIYGSVRSASTALHGPVVWEQIRRLVKEQCPNDQSKWLPDTPPSRTWYFKRRKPMTDAEENSLATLQQRLTDSAVGIAHELGLLDPDGPGTPTHPDPSRMIHHDGKAIRQLFNGAPGDTREVKITDPNTGEVHIEDRPVRADPDAKVHITGDNRQIHGSKFWRAAVRGDDPYTRVTLAVDYVPGVKDEKNSEADIAAKNLVELAPRVPGALGAICDTVLRGTHIEQLQSKTGWTIVNPVTAAKVDPKTKERTEKERYLRTVEFERHGGISDEVEIWIVGGLLCRIEYADDGTRVPIPLRRVGNPKRQNADGSFRTYVEYEVPDATGERFERIMERTNRKADDEDFNRAENIRQIPPGDPDYDRLMGRRSDAEASNRVVDDHLYLRRARSLGAKRQLFDLIAHAFAQNAVARHRHRLTAGPPGEIAA
jgi:hypothetical protein